MAANTSPIFSLAADIQWAAAVVSAANTAKDGTGTVALCFTAGAEGGFVQRIRFRPAGTNIATVARIFINNGSANSTPANNILWDEISLPAITISEVSAQNVFELALNFALPATYKINVVLGTAVSAGYYVSVIGGKY